MNKITLVCIVFIFTLLEVANGQPYNLEKSLEGFDEFVEELMDDWNAPGIGVGIVVKDKLTYSKGFGYRDLENQLPITSETLFSVGSNTKLFTAVAMGMLVEDGKMAWDKPISTYVPQIAFYNDVLYHSVTLRDMLSHRTGIPAYNGVWIGSGLNRKEIFDKLKYLKPVQPISQSMLYNNLLYAVAGYCLELTTGDTWEHFLQKHIFKQLHMHSTCFNFGEVEVKDNVGFRYYEDGETNELVKIPNRIDESRKAIAPAAAMISNIDDMSKWMIMLLNKGYFKGEQIVSENILRETLVPAIPMENRALEDEGYDEILNPFYGMGRSVFAYKGHYATEHVGNGAGFFSKLSLLPYDSIGVFVFVNGTHNRPLVNIISFNIFDRLLDLPQTDFNDRFLKSRSVVRKITEEPEQANRYQVANTIPSHPLADFQGQYEAPAYGTLSVMLKEEQLIVDFHQRIYALEHYHYNRFDTQSGELSLNFSTNPQGEVEKVTIALDESDVEFVRKPESSLADPEHLRMYVGKYESVGNYGWAQGNLEIFLNDKGELMTKIDREPHYTLVVYKPNLFKIKQFGDSMLEFVGEGTKVTQMKMILPFGVQTYNKK